VGKNEFKLIGVSEFNLPPLDQSQVQDIRTVEEVEDLVLRLLRQNADAAG